MEKSKYEDIINLEHPTSLKHPRMSRLNRAAQFAPFAALTGHDAAIQETARLTSEKIELDESQLVILNEKLQTIQEQLLTDSEITFTYFVKDPKKVGGQYITKTGFLKRIDEIERIVILKDKTKIPIEDIVEIDCELLKFFS